MPSRLSDYGQVTRQTKFESGLYPTLRSTLHTEDKAFVATEAKGKTAINVAVCNLNDIIYSVYTDQCLHIFDKPIFAPSVFIAAVY